MHTYNVGIALAEQTFVVFDDVAFGKIKTVEDLAFVVDDALGRIEILGDFFIGKQGAATKTKYAPRDTMNREHHATLEKVKSALVF